MPLLHYQMPEYLLSVDVASIKADFALADSVFSKN